VRAKVAGIRIHQPHLSYSDQRHLASDCHGYLQFAQRFLSSANPALMITMGFSGNGKTTATQQLIESSDVIRVRSDVERKRLFGLEADAASDSQHNAEICSTEATAKTYNRLAELAEVVIKAGFPIVVDATFLKRNDRDRFCRLAKRWGVPFYIIHCDASEETLKMRIQQRQQIGVDASEAGESVLEQQRQAHDPLQDNEARYVIDGTSPELASIVSNRCRKKAQ